jgi:hypothetical protein
MFARCESVPYRFHRSCLRAKRGSYNIVPALGPLRLLVLVLAVLMFVVGVLAHSVFHRRFMLPMLRFAFMGQPIPAFFRNPRVGRAWNLLVVILLLLLWWFLGTRGPIPPSPSP